jgi:hypothetical protein
MRAARLFSGNALLDTGTDNRDTINNVEQE